MKKLNVQIIVLLLLLCGSATVSYGQDRPDRREMIKKRMAMKGEDRSMLPGLTSEQKEKIKEHRMDFYKKVLPLKNELNIKRAQLKALVSEENPDIKEVNDLIEEIGDLQTEMMKESVAHRQEIRKELTEEQRMMFDSHSHRKSFKKRGMEFQR